MTALAEAAPALIGTTGDSLREAFGKTLSELADEFSKVVVLDADIAGGTGVHHFRKSHPERFLQFGIAEQNMMAAAGGLAAVGLLPVVTTFAVFCLRAVEQARLSLCLCQPQRQASYACASRPRCHGPDGGSAQALEDVAAFRAIPGMTVISPADPVEMALATRAILEFEGPVYMRTGRSPARRIYGDDHKFEIGKGDIVRDGTDVTIDRLRRQSRPRPRCGPKHSLPKDDISARVVEHGNDQATIDSELLHALRERAKPAAGNGHGRRCKHYFWRPRRRGGCGIAGARRTPAPSNLSAFATPSALRANPRSLLSCSALAPVTSPKRHSAPSRAKRNEPFLAHRHASAFVTGGSRGIGRAIKLGLAEVGGVRQRRALLSRETPQRSR